MTKSLKLAGKELLIGSGCIERLKTLKGKRAVIVTGGSSMKRSGFLQKVENYLEEAGVSSMVLPGIEPDPSFGTVYKGAKVMREFGPDLIVALGGGSVMDAAKAMRIYYEHPELTTLQQIRYPNTIPGLGGKAAVICIPSTSGSASEVTQAVVIKDDQTFVKSGIVSPELIPEIALCDPEVTVGLPAGITAETGMDALTHALESLVSIRANCVSSALALSAAEDILVNLPKAYQDGGNIHYREIMMNASLMAGMAFTNSSLGIVHSLAHAVGSVFGISHGLADAILLPYVIGFNTADAASKHSYGKLEQRLGVEDLHSLILELNHTIGIPGSFCKVIANEGYYVEKLNDVTKIALKDGCTSGNPVAPSFEQLKELLINAYYAD